jgi:hypothetical protein
MAIARYMATTEEKTYRILRHESLQREADDISNSVPVEEPLASLELFPVYPVRNGMELIPELGQRLVFTAVISKKDVEVVRGRRSASRFAFFE